MLPENLFSGFLTRSDTNRSVKPHLMARSLKFQIKVVEGLYYLCRDSNVGADQLRGYHKCKKHDEAKTVNGILITISRTDEPLPNKTCF